MEEGAAMDPEDKKLLLKVYGSQERLAQVIEDHIKWSREAHAQRDVTVKNIEERLGPVEDFQRVCRRVVALVAVVVVPVLAGVGAGAWLVVKKVWSMIQTHGGLSQ